MRIAVASGKGGTGKTTISVNLALALAEEKKIQFIDCDVEEPNAHLFLNPIFDKKRSISKLLPQIDEELCNQCGKCAQACEFNAIAVLGAISETPHELGVIESGTARGFPFSHGLLNIGEAMATPIIHSLKEDIDPQRLTIIDAPPGTACPTIAALHGADIALLVTEPTPFGLHDLKAAIGVARSLSVPVAVIVNRDGIGDDRVEHYCAQEHIPISSMERTVHRTV
jgi:MinD superfamily P-loop ATPase